MNRFYKFAACILCILLLMAGCTPSTDNQDGNEPAPETTAASEQPGVENGSGAEIVEVEHNNPNEGNVKGTYEASGNKAVVTMNAKVVTPDVPIPVVNVERTKFTAQNLDKLIEALMDGKQALVFEDDPEGLHVDESGAETANYAAALGKEDDASLAVENWEEEGQSTASFNNPDVFGEIYESLTMAEQADKTPEGVTLEEAKALAEKTVGSLESGLSLAAVTLGKLKNISVVEEGEPIVAPEKYGYVFWYTRAVDGVQTTFESTYADIDETKVTDSTGWPYERLSISIDDTGITGLYWYSPTLVKETVTKNATTISADEAVSVFESEVLKKYESLNDDSSVAKANITVDSVVLGLMRVPGENDGEYRLTPVWDFLGTVEYEDESGQTTLQGVKGYTSVLTIDAIESTVVSR